MQVKNVKRTIAALLIIAGLVSIKILYPSFDEQFKHVIDVLIAITLLAYGTQILITGLLLPFVASKKLGRLSNDLRNAFSDVKAGAFKRR